MTTTVSVAIVAAFAVSLSSPAPAPATERRGAVAFHYGPRLTPKQLAFLGRFDVLVTHDPLPAEQVTSLRKSGTKLVLYEWSVAFYRTLVQPGSWHASILGNRDALLNTHPLRGGVGAPDADAFYYDPASRAHEVERARALVRKLRAIRYDGVFLDTTTIESVHPDALAEYWRRHPKLEYDAAFSRFLANLRRELGDGGVIITNQGYRAAEHYLPYVDYEITESLITRPGKNGRYELRPFNDPRDRWNSIDVIMRELIGPVKKQFPRVPFVHLNYGEGDDVRKVLAIARRFGDDAFVASPDVTATLIDPVYFDDEFP